MTVGGFCLSRNLMQAVSWWCFEPVSFSMDWVMKGQQFRIFLLLVHQKRVVHILLIKKWRCCALAPTWGPFVGCGHKRFSNIIFNAVEQTDGVFIAGQLEKSLRSIHTMLGSEMFKSDLKFLLTTWVPLTEMGFALYFNGLDPKMISFSWKNLFSQSVMTSRELLFFSTVWWKALEKSCSQVVVRE